MSTAILRNRNASQSKIPKAPNRRSIFDYNWNRKQTMNASYITPITCKRIIPGQSIYLNTDIFMRMTTQLTCPIDNLQVETFFFYAPDRILWENHKYFIGEVKDPNKPQTDYLIPQIEIPANKNTAGSLFNLLSASRLNKKVKVSKLPFVMHNLVYNEYFRDPDCQSPKVVDITDKDGNITDYDLYRIHKSRDYFTNSTRDIQQGETVTLPLGTEAPIRYNMSFSGSQIYRTPTSTPKNMKIGGKEDKNNNGFTVYNSDDPINPNFAKSVLNVGSMKLENGSNANIIDGHSGWANLDLNDSHYADLKGATATTINALAQAIMTEEYLQALNRGGTKYVDVMKNIYDVTIPDLTIQRPMYLGGTSKPFFTNPVVQTSASDINGTLTPQGNIAGYGTFADGGRIINASFQEFGYIIGYIVIKAQPQYQQGLDRHWTEQDEYEIFNPFFNNAPDQPIYRQEIFVEDYDAVDENNQNLNKKIYGYIGRNDHFRYQKNEIAGELNSEYKYPLDIYHYAEKFENAPENNADFMEDKTAEILERTLAVVWEDEEKTIRAPQFIVDIEFNGAATLPIPTHAVPKISAFI